MAVYSVKRAGEIVQKRIELTMQERGVDYLTAFDIVQRERPGLLQKYTDAHINERKRINTLRETFKNKYPKHGYLWRRDDLLRAVLEEIDASHGDIPYHLAIAKVLKRKSERLYKRWLSDG